MSNEKHVRHLGSLVLHLTEGLFFEDSVVDGDEFGATLWPGSTLVFRRLPLNPKCFVAAEVRASNFQAPGLPILKTTVLWRRREALEVEKQFVVLRKHLGWPPAP